MRSLKIGLGLAFLLSLTGVAGASYPYTVDSSVSVCDPQSPTHCTRPNADGSTNVGQGTPGAVTAGWPIVAGEPADTTGTFTNATQATAITTPSVDGYQTATITIKGTYATASATFLASDDGGTTYFSIQCARTDGSVAELGYTNLTNVSRAWYCPMHGFDSIEVLSSAVATGTVSVHISISAFATAFGGLEAAVPTDKNGTQADYTIPTLVVPSSQYPNSATPVGGPGSGTTGAVVGTLPAVSGKTNYICGVTVSAIGGVAAVGPIVVAGLKGGSQTYQLVSTATGVTMPNPFAGSVCFPASAVTTAITATTTADGTASAVNVNIWGYVL